MSKRRLPRNAAARIGNERIAILLELAEQAVRDGRDDRAIRYVTLARRIGMKTRTTLPPGFRYCRECMLPMIPGSNCSVRLTGRKVVSTCGSCGAVRRVPYLRENRK
ncbi:MAG: ribonuclease P protein component 4 [Euryarchaeota archaeon]|nr:ribonuclease P protein component 4 [Euryarchaeota archaeon]